MNETKFKPGDKVRVKSDLVVSKEDEVYYSMENSTDSDIITEEMACMLGKECTIQSVNSGGYKLKEDTNYWNWTDEMFEEIVPEYVEYIGDDGDFTYGKIYTFPNPTDDIGSKRSIKILQGFIYTFKPSTKEAFDAQNKPKYVKFLSDRESYIIAGRIYEVESWDREYKWVRCNLTCGDYEPGTSLCVNIENSIHKDWEVVTEQEYLNQVKPKFEVGKWYEWYQENHGKKHYGKLRAIYDKHFVMSPWICNSKSYTNSGTFLCIYAKDIKEISVNVIQQYLPEGHREKALKPKTLTFETGDVLVCTTSGNEFFTQGALYHAITDTDLLDNNGDYHLATPDWTYENFRIATEADIKPKEWSVGTYVVFVKDYGHSSKVGSIDIIKESNKPGTDYVICRKELTTTISPEFVKWFPTLSEAKAFSKELLTPKTFKLGQYEITVDASRVKVGCSYLQRNEVIKLLDSFIYISEKFDDNSFIEINGLRVTLSTAYKLRDYINEY